MTAHLLAIALGGAIGGAARFWVSRHVARWMGEQFPWGTLAVNLSGAFVIGIVAGATILSQNLQAGQGLFWGLLVTGILGSYTTVSSLSLQTLTLYDRGHKSAALANMAITVVAGLGLAAFGIGLGMALAQ
jgi:fluoride exporter